MIEPFTALCNLYVLYLLYHCRHSAHGERSPVFSLMRSATSRSIRANRSVRIFAFVCTNFLNHIGHLAKRGFALWGGQPDTPGTANRALKIGGRKN